MTDQEKITFLEGQIGGYQGFVWKIMALSLPLTDEQLAELRRNLSQAVEVGHSVHYSAGVKEAEDKCLEIIHTIETA